MSEFDKIAAALVRAQSAMKLPEKNREVTVQPKQRQDGSYPKPYKFWYTTFDELVENVRKPLTNNGIWFTQEICGEHGKPQLRTTLWHDSGQHIQSVMPIIAAGQDAQSMGSAISYAKRYALSALLGQPSDDDDDANAADGNAVVERHDKARSAHQGAKPNPQEPKQEKHSGMAGDLSSLRIYNGSTFGRMPSAEAKRKGYDDELKRELHECQSIAEVAQFLKERQNMINTLPLAWLEPLENQILNHEAELRKLLGGDQ